MINAFIARIVYHNGYIGFGVIIALVGIFLLFAWKYKIENFKNLLRDPEKLRANFKMLIPGLAFLGLAVYIFLGPATTRETFDRRLPILANLYIANATNEEGRIVCGTQEEVLAPHEEREVMIHSGDNRPGLQLWLGERLLIDTFIVNGNFLGSFGGGANVVAEEIVYTQNGRGLGSPWSPYDTYPKLVTLTTAGIKQFGLREKELEIYAFDHPAPKEVEVMFAIIAEERKWDVKSVSDAELLLRKAGHPGGPAED